MFKSLDCNDNGFWVVQTLGCLTLIIGMILGLAYISNHYTLQENKIIERMVASGADPVLAMCAAHNRIGSDSTCLARSLQVGLGR